MRKKGEGYLRVLWLIPFFLLSSEALSKERAQAAAREWGTWVHKDLLAELLSPCSTCSGTFFFFSHLWFRDGLLGYSEGAWRPNGSDVLAWCGSGCYTVMQAVSTCLAMFSCRAAGRCLTECTCWVMESQELCNTSRQSRRKLVTVDIYLFRGRSLWSSIGWVVIRYYRCL